MSLTGTSTTRGGCCCPASLLMSSSPAVQPISTGS